MDTGLLGNFDPAQLQQLMQQFGATEAEKKDANKQALFALGFGLLGGRRGQEMATIGHAGMGAMQYRQQVLDDMQKQKFASIHNAAGAIGLQDKLLAMQEQQQYRNYKPKVAGSMPAASSPPAPSGPPPISADYGASQMPPPGAPAQSPASIAPAPQQSQQYDPAAQLLAEIQQAHTAYVETKNPLFLQQRNAAIKEWQSMREKIGEPKVGMVNGKAAFTRYGDYGSQQNVAGVTPPPEFMTIDRGGSSDVVNKYNLPSAGQSFGKTMSPDSIASNQVALGHLALARRADARAADNENSGQVVQGEGGFYRVPKKGAAVPVPAADGSQLQTPMPATIKEKVALNNVTLGKIDAGLNALDAYPGAFGLANLAGDTVRQRTDPKGVMARAAIADIAGQKIHDRSGGNVTIGEAKRLEPYVPNVTDKPETVKIKLQGLRREYAAMQQELAGGKSISEVAGAVRGGAGGKIVRFQDLSVR